MKYLFCLTIIILPFFTHATESLFVGFYSVTCHKEAETNCKSELVNGSGQIRIQWQSHPDSTPKLKIEQSIWRSNVHDNIWDETLFAKLTITKYTLMDGHILYHLTSGVGRQEDAKDRSFGLYRLWVTDLAQITHYGFIDSPQFVTNRTSDHNTGLYFGQRNPNISDGTFEQIEKRFPGNKVLGSTTFISNEFLDTANLLTKQIIDGTPLEQRLSEMRSMAETLFYTRWGVRHDRPPNQWPKLTNAVYVKRVRKATWQLNDVYESERADLEASIDKMVAPLRAFQASGAANTAYTDEEGQGLKHTALNHLNDIEALIAEKTVSRSKVLEQKAFLDKNINAYWTLGGNWTTLGTDVFERYEAVFSYLVENNQ